MDQVWTITFNRLANLQPLTPTSTALVNLRPSTPNPDSLLRSRLEAEGYAMFGLTGAEDGELYRDAIVRLYVPESTLPYHCFTRVSSPGDVIGQLMLQVAL